MLFFALSGLSFNAHDIFNKQSQAAASMNSSRLTDWLLVKNPSP